MTLKAIQPHLKKVLQEYLNGVKNAKKRDLEKPFIPEDNADFIQAIERCFISSYLLGMIHAEEENPDRKINAADTEIPPIRFEEAVKFLKAKVPMSKKAWLKLEPKLRFRAFTVAKLGTVREIDKAKNVLIKTLENGGSYASSWEDLKTKINTNTMLPGYWENVFRTNTQTAYMAGKLQQYEQMDGIVAYQLFVIEDSRTSNICQRLLNSSGRGIILSKDNDFWKTNGFPPYHFQCRSSVRALFNSQIGKTGLTIEDSKSLKEFKPLKGFGGNPNFWELTDSQKKQIKKFGLQESFEIAEEYMLEEISQVDNYFEYLSKIEEANNYSMNTLGIPLADWDGVAVEVANEVNKTIEDYFKKFPELKEQIKFVGESYRRIDLLRERYIAEKEKEFVEKLIKKSLKLSTDKIYELARGQALNDWKKTVQKIRISTTSVAISHNIENKFLNNFNGISFNKNNTNNFSNLIKMLEDNVRDKYHPVGTASVKALVDHEMAHKLDKLLDLRHDNVIIKLHRKLTTSEITEGLSKYAWNNSNSEPISEFIAEAWSEYCNNSNPRPIAKTIGKRIEELYKTWMR